MANLCTNIVEFKGDERRLAEIRALFEKLADKETKQGQGQIPSFVKQEDGFMHDIRWEDELLYYHTKWAPNLETMLMVAKHFQVNYTHFYSEPGSLLYGEAVYENGRLNNFILSAGDFKSYKHDKENDSYFFEGKEYEDAYEIWEILLERRKKK